VIKIIEDRLIRIEDACEKSWLFVKKHKYKFLIAAIAVIVVAAVGTVSYSAGYNDGQEEAEQSVMDIVNTILDKNGGCRPS